MKIRPIGQLGTHLRRVAPSVRSSELRQSRRIEGQLDQGGEMRVFPQIHLWIHRAIPLDGDLVRATCKAVVTVQRSEGWHEYRINIRQFDAHGIPTDPPDRVRLAMRSNSTVHRLERTLRNLRNGEVPEADRRRPMPSKPNRNDLVLVVIPGLDAQVHPGLETFTSATNGKRVFWCFADEGGFADDRQNKTTVNMQTKRERMMANQSRMPVVGYSERGLVNALVGYLRTDLSRVRSFLSRIECVGKRGRSAIATLADSIDGCSFVVEAGFSQFGDPDLILVCQKRDEQEPWLIFIEAKVVDYRESAKRPNGPECMSRSKGKATTGYNSQIHGQLSLKYRLVNALSKHMKGTTLVEEEGLHLVYCTFQGDPIASPRKLEKKTNIDSLVPKLLSSAGGGDDALLNRSFFVALTTDKHNPLGTDSTKSGGDFFPQYLNPDKGKKPPLDLNTLAGSHTGWVGWHDLADGGKLEGLADDPDFQPVWELVREDWDIRQKEKIRCGGSSIRTQPIETLDEDTLDLYTRICALVESKIRTDAPALTGHPTTGSYSLIYRKRTIGKIIPQTDDRGAGILMLGVAGVPDHLLPGDFRGQPETINGKQFQLACISSTANQADIESIVQIFIDCLSKA